MDGKRGKGKSKDKDHENENGKENEKVKEKIAIIKKDLKKLKKQIEDEENKESEKQDGTEQFTLSQANQGRSDQLLETSNDIKVEGFSISARGRTLFSNATLLVAFGRRYGLVGPNGMASQKRVLKKNFFIKNLLFF